MKRQPHSLPLGYQGKLSGKSIIVTGGAGQFGLYLAQAVIDEGANVLLSSSCTVEEPVFVEPDGGSMVWASGDPRDPQYALALVRYACRTFGRLDALIDNTDYEFETLWPAEPSKQHPPGRRGPDGAAENFDAAALEGMAPGGVVIHAQGPGGTPRACSHPPLMVGAARQTSTAALLARLGIRVLTVYPGTRWVAGLVEGSPPRLSEQSARAIAQQNAYLITLLAENGL